MADTVIISRNGFSIVVREDWWGLLTPEGDMWFATKEQLIEYCNGIANVAKGITGDGSKN